MCESLRFLHGGDCRIGRRVGRFFRTDFRDVGDGFPCRDLRGAGIGCGAFRDARLRFLPFLMVAKNGTPISTAHSAMTNVNAAASASPLDTSFPNQSWL